MKSANINEPDRVGTRQSWDFCPGCSFSKPLDSTTFPQWGRPTFHERQNFKEKKKTCRTILIRSTLMNQSCDKQKTPDVLSVLKDFANLTFTYVKESPQ